MTKTFLLPAKTKCPKNPQGFLSPDQVSLILRKAGGFYATCSTVTGCGERHSRSQFEETGDAISVGIYDKAFEWKKGKTYIEARRLMEPSHEEISPKIPEPSEEEISSKKPGRPRKAIDKDVHIVSMVHSKDKVKRNCDELAALYQDSVEVVQKVDKRDKQRPSESFRSNIWSKENGNLTHVKCPVCMIYTIHTGGGGFDLGHIFPECYGGELVPQNLIPICSICNSCMGTKHLASFAWKQYHNPRFLLQ
jgi:hypothetical protein